MYKYFGVLQKPFQIISNFLPPPFFFKASICLVLSRELANGISILRTGWGDGFIFPTCEFIKQIIISEGQLFNISGRTEISVQLIELEPYKHLRKVSSSQLLL